MLRTPSLCGRGKKVLFFFFSLFSMSLSAQSVTGFWQGVVQQPDNEITYRYQLRLSQTANAVSGKASVSSQDGMERAEFLVSGTINSDQLQLQEIEQLLPGQNPWCLKFLSLTIGPDQLTGSWTAQGCQPGTATLYRTGASRRFEETFPLGRWTGELKQSDRDYGFYFELTLQPNGTGSSHIVSEGNGGEAFHELRWEREAAGTLLIRETTVNRKTDPNWRWCVKTMRLQPDTTLDSRQLSGPWWGNIENTDGACAPGTIELSQLPTLRDSVQAISFASDQYRAKTGRVVRVDRLIKVQSDRIYIRVWDAGTVDGDVATVFLNGERIVHNQRVTKRKTGIRVKIKPGENLLILHAEDLGDIIPNTVAVGIDDGIEMQTVILNSNLSESGAILIQPFTRE
jgi:hypothetical protein